MGKDLKGKELGDYLSQRKDGTYMARFTDRFGRRKCLYSGNLRKLKDRLNEHLYEDKNHLNIVDESITLNEWFGKWLDVYKHDTIRQSTKQHYTQVYEKHISPTLGRLAVCEITQLMVRTLLRDKAEAGYKYGTLNKIRVLLLDMYDKAIIDDFAKKNPARGIRLKQDEKKDVRALSLEEQRLFFECAKGTFYYNLFVFAVNTGLRPGELCALTWEDIDLVNNVVSVSKTLLYQKLEGDMNKTFHLDPPKTSQSNRKVPLNKAAVLAIKNQKQQSDIVKSKSNKHRTVPTELKNLLFVTSIGTPINAETFGDNVSRIVREINLMRDPLEELDLFTPHCFRHTFATRCFESGIAPKTVQTYLGHASLKMTMDLYTHVMEDKLQEDIKKLDVLMECINNPTDEY